jgi:hypothetical protein
MFLAMAVSRHECNDYQHGEAYYKANHRLSHGILPITSRSSLYFRSRVSF